MKLVLIVLICLGTAIVAKPTEPLNINWSVRIEQGRDATELVNSALKSLQERKFDEVLASCAKALELDPREYRAYALSGYAYQGQHKFKSASEAMRTALSLSLLNC